MTIRHFFAFFLTSGLRFKNTWTKFYDNSNILKEYAYFKTQTQRKPNGHLQIGFNNDTQDVLTCTYTPIGGETTEFKSIEEVAEYFGTKTCIFI